jgi:hypothetical protein
MHSFAAASSSGEHSVAADTPAAVTDPSIVVPAESTPDKLALRVAAWHLDKTLLVPDCLFGKRKLRGYFRCIRFGPELFGKQAAGFGKQQKFKKNPYDLPLGTIVSSYNIVDARVFWQYGDGGSPSKPWKIAPGKLPGRDHGHAWDWRPIQDMFMFSRPEWSIDEFTFAKTIDWDLEFKRNWDDYKRWLRIPADERARRLRANGRLYLPAHQPGRWRQVYEKNGYLKIRPFSRFVHYHSYKVTIGSKTMRFCEIPLGANYKTWSDAECWSRRRREPVFKRHHSWYQPPDGQATPKSTMEAIKGV